MTEIDIKQLTADAEAGHGCVLERQLGELFFEEQVSLLEKVKLENSGASHTTKLVINHGFDDQTISAYPYMEVRNGIKLTVDVISSGKYFNSQYNIYTSTYDPRTNGHGSSCHNVEK